MPEKPNPSFWQYCRKLLPTAVLIVLAILAGATDTFSQRVHETLHQAFGNYLLKLMPLAIDLIVAVIVVSIARVLYNPLCSGIEKVLTKTGASKQAQALSIKLLKFFYWAMIVFLVLSLTEAEILSRFVIGFGVFGAALTLSLQGAANDFICGLLIQFSRKIADNDEVQLEGIEVAGKVSSVGYLSTIVESQAALIHVPNREIWGRAVRVMKPAPSPILLPPGVEYPDQAKLAGDKN